MDTIKQEYRAAADALRTAVVETPEMLARYESAKAAYDASRPKPVPRVIRGWYDLEIAASMWAADGRDLRA